MKNIPAGHRVHVAAGSESLISSSGLSLLAQTASVSGLSDALSAGLSSWRKPTAFHDPGKVVLDLVLSIAAGGVCLADVSLVRAQPELFGQVASDPTISRLVDVLGADPVAAVAAIRSARASARGWVWGHRNPFTDGAAAVVVSRVMICGRTVM